ncbi:MAG: winged helix-turn-helix domain-containing protein [Bacteroidales bacterium]|nr:winged helix-turn-helix domain-containing protein [Bacteroidales bacterium]
MGKILQTEQVIQALRNEGGYATFKRLNEIIDFSTWKTKTPEASVRRIVQVSDQIFRLRPGLWALEEMRDVVMKKFQLKEGDSKSEEKFTHGYYQGLLVEIGKLSKHKTYVPAQDKSRLYLGQRLGDVSDTTDIPCFTYDYILRKAKTVDVIWFNERNLPSDFYEVEHTTDIKNSLSKFFELQDFYADFFIVADKCRKKEFEDKLHVSIFNSIENRVKFLDYDRVVGMYEGLKQVEKIKW